MSASIEDVAKRAGVSIATVSRSLRGLPDVAASTRDRVVTAARELDYVASPFAARLASGRSSTLGVVVPFINRWFFAEVLGAVETVLSAAGYDLLLHNLGDSDGRERFFSMLPVRKRVDAVLVVSLALSDYEVEALSSLELPVGVLGVKHPGLFSVRIDDVAAARSAVRHLLSLGHRRIALIGGDTDDPMRFTPPHHRGTGYRDALTDAGIDVDPALEGLGYFTVAGGEAAMLQLLALDERPTAVFAESDEMAYGAMRTIRRAGLRVPYDIAVVGFDDHATAGLLDLSTVRQPVAEQGALLARGLLASLAHDTEPSDLVLDTELVVRGSTVPAASVYAQVGSGD
ncbi:LacI family DNA-binding transcriptional regulator [Jatrophihabitans lederbergiae]|uniref:LacI family DNA-binding transcriptional regulator n=1 Tax=Jatrophihabitans lederbergiae TaxID=3075547 RepID=A0ABU2JD48_9ACTN|nr:LacI family DNA-binding transcriptional regulator [Jatrophihabitans sp. DSM 44399]MDT0262867.1 LacI family DNA-binding transcriptional regulator [Jatrophihabitans sp. DSM 44399]